MLESSREFWRSVKEGEPGRRFRDAFDERRSRRSESRAWARPLALALAIGLIVVGLAIGWLPGPGGVIAVFGVALLAKESRLVAGLLDRIESGARSAFKWCANLSPGAKAVGVVVCAAIIGAGLYFGLGLL